jgi:hypothetical protein
MGKLVGRFQKSDNVASKYFSSIITCSVCLLLFALQADAAPALAPIAPPASAAQPSVIALEKIALLALSQYDGRAVLGFPDRQMAVLKVGDKVPHSAAVVMQVLSDKLILQEAVAGNGAKQVVWMHKGQGGQPGRIERLNAVAAPAHIVQAPLRQALEMPQADTAVPGSQQRKP